MPLTLTIPCHQVDAAVQDAEDRLSASDGRSAMDRVAALWSLSFALLSRFTCTHSSADLDRAVTAVRTARELVPAARPEARTMATWLAMLLGSRNRPEDVVEAMTTIEAVQRRVRSASVEHATLDMVYGALLIPQYLRFRHADDLAGAIGRLERALEVLDREVANDRSSPQLAAVTAQAAAMTRSQLVAALTAREGSPDADEHDAERIRALLATVDRLSPEAAFAADSIERVRVLQQGLVRGEGADPLTVARSVSFAQDVPHPGAVGHLTSLGELLQDSVRYGVQGDLHALDAQIHAMETQRADPDQHDSDPPSTVAGLAMLYQLRSRTKALSDDPSAGPDRIRATDLAEEALALAGGSGDVARMVLAGCKLDDYRPDGPNQHLLDDAVTLLRRATSGGTLSPELRRVARAQLAEALAARGWRDGDLDQIDEAVDLVTTHRDRFRPGSLHHAIASSRVAAMLHVRAEATGTTEDQLRAADASRKAATWTAEHSLIWAFDTALAWADWSWRRRRMDDAGDACLLALRALNRLARAQLSRAHSELILRRRSQSLVGRAGYALARRDRLTEAVVALESGRAVLLSTALERDLVGLSGPRHAPVRDRYRRAVQRLHELEERALHANLDPEDEERA
ncbi:hypothetical protein AB0B85_17045 [Micromonospora sp. NPDC049044]|uniref:hypothetical protein n=1 Tax=unclassified Micromonospora TaxID=2617518 RepID=UPI0033C191DB